jgi:murein DD-endopeptidase MepM/ murein hydrolase activator NlpD
MNAFAAAVSIIVALLAAPPPGPADQHAVWPLDPRPEIAAGFVAPEHTWSAGHRGVDLVGAPGQAVRSALPGRVTFAGTIAGRGVVVVDHGGFRTTYEPVSAVLHVGDPTLAGTVVGTLQTGRSHCPPRTCLHWGLITGTGYRDPLTLLGLGPIRLLPLTGEYRFTPAGAPGDRPSGVGRW